MLLFKKIEWRKRKFMKILKRNQIIIIVIALMLVTAGYLNYTTNHEGEIPTSASTEEKTDMASIGDAKLVSSNGIIDKANNEQTLVSNENGETKNEQETAIVENNSEQTSASAGTNIADTNANSTSNSIATSTTSKETKEYFSSSKLSRETMYSQMIESYRKILENETISETQKSIAQTEIKNINDIKNKIMICENLIKTKEIEDLVIFVNDKSISVVVRTDKLEQEQIAQIQNIIQREMQVEISNIHISNK